jgi:hypothetical protein
MRAATAFRIMQGARARSKKTCQCRDEEESRGHLQLREVWCKGHCCNYLSLTLLLSCKRVACSFPPCSYSLSVWFFIRSAAKRVVMVVRDLIARALCHPWKCALMRWDFHVHLLLYERCCVWWIASHTIWTWPWNYAHRWQFHGLPGGIFPCQLCLFLVLSN